MNKKTIKKIAITFVIVLFIIAFQVFDLGQYLTLSYIKESQAKFEALYAEHPAMVIVSYMILYILATSFSLPGAAILTLAGGALFGLLTGTVIVSFASTIGATIACFFSRFLLRDWIQGKFADRIQKVNEGIAKEGAFYLFTLRLLPVFPFWMINILMGLTTMPLFKFYWVSQLGMLPGTLVYVNAGKELAQIDSPGGILSPGLLLSFVLIGIFPLTVKKLIGWYRAKKGE
ncbi:MAG: TVP38/TMEM64 family protein [Thermodesulfovibrionales bacterium]|nr:TVP38/TMEM64 family protein [Thermodesulfovibrionales bacterium]